MTKQLSIQAIFDELLAGESVTVVSPPAAMRIALHKKLKSYRDAMSQYGFLSERIENASLSAKKLPDGSVTFSLSEKKQSATYSIVSPVHHEQPPQ